jgi:hypothetical protein
MSVPSSNNEFKLEINHPVLVTSLFILWVLGIWKLVELVGYFF